MGNQQPQLLPPPRNAPTTTTTFGVVGAVILEASIDVQACEKVVAVSWRPRTQDYAQWCFQWGGPALTRVSPTL